jgi:hypothetical protein
MRALTIKEVVSDSDYLKFLKFPYRLYRDCKNYVPNLFEDEKKFFKSPCLDYCLIKSWIVLEKNKVVGRISAIINPRYNDTYNTKKGRFSLLEFEKDIKILELLISAAEDWLAKMGMEQVQGPLGYNTWYKQGMLVDGFDNMPPINCIYNFPYYPEMLEQMGYSKEADWVQYKLAASQGAPERLKRLNDILLKRYNLRIMGREEFVRRKGELAAKFFENYNDTFSTVHNFVALTDKEKKELGLSYLSMLDPELCCFVMDDTDSLAAYGICFPSLSKAFKKANGHIFPLGWFHISRAMKHYDVVDLMMVGAAPKWKNKGISAIYHNILANTFIEHNLKYAITNPQIEDNTAVKVWDGYRDCEPFMRRRCFVKNIK